MKNILLVLFTLLSISIHAQFSNMIVFIGPKFNFNISKGENRFSGAIEASAWTFNSNADIPIGADFGVEFEKDRCRIYGEFQAGALLGLSLGPVVELTKENQVFGFQSSVWAAVFLGTDFRYRRINSSNYFAPGFFFKVPILKQGSNGLF